MSSEFHGFPTGLVGFFQQLTMNNDRDWFQANKDRYEADVREPARAFIRAMGERLGEVSPHLVADDRKSGGSLMRIFRDTRFSTDKTPCKTNVGIQFRHSAGKDVHAPGLYVHFDLENVFVGVGMWRPESSALDAIRAKIDEDGDRWARITSDATFTATFRQHTDDALKRAPRGYPKDHPHVESLKLRSHIVACDLEPDAVHQPDLVDTVMDRYAKAADYVKFLCDAIGQPF
jgi:uncharacterized protein (TIGR02453 family)